MQGTVLARLTGCNIAGLSFFVRSQAVPAKAISRIYAKTMAAPARGACRPIRMRTCKVTRSTGTDFAGRLVVSIGDLAAGLGSARLAFMAAPRNFAVMFDRGVSSTDLADRVERDSARGERHAQRNPEVDGKPSLAQSALARRSPAVIMEAPRRLCRTARRRGAA